MLLKKTKGGKRKCLYLKKYWKFIPPCLGILVELEKKKKGKLTDLEKEIAEEIAWQMTVESLLPLKKHEKLRKVLTGKDISNMRIKTLKRILWDCQKALEIISSVEPRIEHPDPIVKENLTEKAKQAINFIVLKLNLIIMRITTIIEIKIGKKEKSPKEIDITLAKKPFPEVPC